MMISTKGRYALRFLVDVAEHQGDGYVPLKDVAARQEISEKYLEIVVKELVKGGLLAAALDNAVEGCADSSEPYIHIRVEQNVLMPEHPVRRSEGITV